MRKTLSASKPTCLLEDAGKDPIKRAELISNNLVQSISVIPEAIVRDVYIKECAQLLRVEDKLLVSEVAKRREMQAEKANLSELESCIVDQPEIPPSTAAVKHTGLIRRLRLILVH